MFISELSYEMMDHCIATCIRFKLKSFSTKSVCFHLVGVELLNILYEGIQFYVNVWLCSAVQWKKVDESDYRARILRSCETYNAKKSDEAYSSDP